ncbi:Calx-beta domain-containing protein, partial [Marinilabilia sp.]|uniref:Calx-beta domain-containing protein n=1 Tax=Marinilabilia sp. TaxID=2021252 RepID=UPI0025B7D4E3
MGLKNSVLTTYISGFFLVFGTLTSAQDISIDQPGASFPEEGGVATITVRTDLIDPVNNITVNLGFSGSATLATDYSASQTSILIPAGIEYGTATLTGISDEIFEGTETITVEITSVSGGTASVGSPASLDLQITDNETAPEVSISASPTSFAENSSTTITLSMTPATTETVTVNLAVTDGTTTEGDYNFSDTQVQFEAGETQQQFVISGNEDGISEGTETFSIGITNVTGGSATMGTQDTQNLEITDNDGTPAASISASAASFSEAAGASVITVSLSPASSQPVTVDLGVTGGTASTDDYLFPDTQVSFAAGETSKPVTITGDDDLIFEGTETLTVAITGVTGGGASVGSPAS